MRNILNGAEEANLSCGLDAFPNAEITNDPGQDETQDQFPPKAAHVLDATGDFQNPAPGRRWEVEKWCGWVNVSDKGRESGLYVEENTRMWRWMSDKEEEERLTTSGQLFICLSDNKKVWKLIKNEGCVNVFWAMSTSWSCWCSPAKTKVWKRGSGMIWEKKL